MQSLGAIFPSGTAPLSRAWPASTQNKTTQSHTPATTSHQTPYEQVMPANAISWRYIPLRYSAIIAGMARSYTKNNGAVLAAPLALNIQPTKPRYTTAPNWKIGRYIAIIKPPTKTPSTDIISGSIKAVKPSTALSTSAS